VSPRAWDPSPHGCMWRRLRAQRPGACLADRRTYHLIASSVGEKLKWMQAVADALHDRRGGDLRAREETLAAATAPLLQHAWAQWNDGDDAAAEATYEDILICHPQCWMALQDRGNFHLRRRRLERAEADFTAALHLHVDSAALWNDRAAARIEARRLDEVRVRASAALACAKRLDVACGWRRGRQRPWLLRLLLLSRAQWRPQPCAHDPPPAGTRRPGTCAGAAARLCCSALQPRQRAANAWRLARRQVGLQRGAATCAERRTDVE
jgi:tetratricopeptide (TPR) repeat protein